MLFASRNMSGPRTTHCPRDFSVNCQPMMSAPVSEEWWCLMGPDVLVSTAIRLAWLSLVRKILRRDKLEELGPYVRNVGGLGHNADALGER